MGVGEGQHKESIFDYGTLERPYTIPTGTLKDIIENSIILADKEDKKVFFEFHGRIFEIDKDSRWELVQGRSQDSYSSDSDNDYAQQQVAEVLNELKAEAEERARK